MLSSHIPKRIKESTIFAILNTVPIAKWPIRIWAFVTIWDTVIDQVPSRWEWPKHVPTFGDVVGMIFGAVPLWIWFYIPLVLMFIASIEFFGIKIRGLGEKNTELFNQIKAARDELRLISDTEILDKQIRRINRVYEILTAAEDLPHITKYIAQLETIIKDNNAQNNAFFRFSMDLINVPEWDTVKSEYESEIGKALRAENIDPQSRTANQRADIKAPILLKYLKNLRVRLAKKARIDRYRDDEEASR